MPENSEVQDHLGDLQAKRNRWADAIASWNKALAGDGQDVEKAAIEKKISNAKGKVQNAR
jgi:predicted negative regulator of RcsB-dependent stress response